MRDLNQWILRTDASGCPLEWITYQDAVKFHFSKQIAYAHGNLLYKIRGGINAKTHKQSIVDVHTIIATYGNIPGRYLYCVPPLNNIALFRRDAFLCMYCGNTFNRRGLSRDHVQPLSIGGRDTWNNVVAACRKCNNWKAGRTPEKAQMQLLAVPFTPTRAEYIYLQSRNILASQMEFLKAHFPKNSPLHMH